MTPEQKIEAKDKILAYLKHTFPDYPNLQQPTEVLKHLPNMYEILVRDKFISSQEVPYPTFEAYLVDIYRGKSLEATLANFF